MNVVLNLRRGFTLIELLIVIAIMGVLIAVAASSFQTSRIKGKDAKRKSDLKQIQTALEAYYNDHGLYPKATGGVITACGSGGNSNCNFGSSFTDENGTVYMAQLPNDSSAPTIGYQYYVSSDQKQYQIFAYLENAQDSAIISLPGKNCPTASYPCNYGVSSANTTPVASMP